MKEEIKIRINGEDYELTIDPRTTLLRLLREELDITGPKQNCDGGACGACTVLVNGKAVKSCLVLALQVDGMEVTSIEGLAQGEVLHPVQQAFVEKGAIQCGFCTSGMVMTAKSFLEENPSPTEEEVRYAIAGNLCRCTGYVKIVEAILTAAENIQKIKEVR